MDSGASRNIAGKFISGLSVFSSMMIEVLCNPSAIGWLSRSWDGCHLGSSVLVSDGGDIGTNQ